MTKTADRENLVAVKQALAAKYESLAKVASSKVKQRSFLHNAEKYRQQATRLEPSKPAKAASRKKKAVKAKR